MGTPQRHDNHRSNLLEVAVHSLKHQLYERRVRVLDHNLFQQAVEVAAGCVLSVALAYMHAEV